MTALPSAGPSDRLTPVRDRAARPPALELRNVVKEYPGNPPVRALDDVSLVVEHGEMLAVVGPSGSGKSTMLHMMGTLDRPTSGSVLIEGTDTSELGDKRVAALRGRKIGFVFQRFFLLAGTTALENVANGLLYSGTPPVQRRRAAEEALHRVGLGHRMHHSPSELSGGESQRVAVARALIHQPTFLLADEPTGNLDSKSSEGIMDLLLGLHDDGTTIAVITHDHDTANSLPRRVSLLDGRIHAEAIDPE